METLDAGFDVKNPSKKGTFQTFAQWKTSSLPNLIGGFSDLKYEDLNAKKHAIESCIKGDLRMQIFMKNIIKLDLLSRICDLSDTITNASNYGFTQFDDSTFEFRLIDFRVPGIKEDSLLTTIGGFVVGNGKFNYNGEHVAVKYTLHNRPQLLRMREAHTVITKDMEGLLPAVETAHRLISTYINTNEVFKEEAPELIGELARYAEAIAHNFNLFKIGIESEIKLEPK